MRDIDLILRSGALKELMGFKNKKYKVIYPDPPWDYKQKGGGKKKGSKRGTANQYYQTMTLEESTSWPLVIQKNGR